MGLSWSTLKSPAMWHWDATTQNRRITKCDRQKTIKKGREFRPIVPCHRKISLRHIYLIHLHKINTIMFTNSVIQPAKFHLSSSTIRRISLFSRRLYMMYGNIWDSHRNCTHVTTHSTAKWANFNLSSTIIDRISLRGYAIYSVPDAHWQQYASAAE